MKTLKKLIILALLVILSVSGVYAKERSKARVAKVNLALLATLHPQMSLFNYRAVGFLRVPLGLNHKEFEEAKAKLLSDYQSKERASDELTKARLYREEVNTKLTDFINKNNIINSSELPQAIEKEYKKLELLLEDAKIQELNYRYMYQYPQYTSPLETIKKLDEIDKEVIIAVKAAAEKNNYEVVLNSSLPVPFGYPVKYKERTTYFNGPSDIEQSIYYSFLAEPQNSTRTKSAAAAGMKDFLRIVQQPHYQDYVPLKPYPVVLSGGDDILLESLKIIYKKYNIKDEIYLFISELLKKEKIIE